MSRCLLCFYNTNCAEIKLFYNCF